MDMRTLLRWAAGALGAPAQVEVVRGLREGAAPWLVAVRGHPEVTEAVLRVSGPWGDAALATEATALRLVEEHQVPAPRVLAADLDGSRAGVVALMTTVLPGTSQIPVTATPGRLRAFGAAIGSLARIPAPPGTGLPERTAPIPWQDFGTREEAPLLRAAHDLRAGLPVPDGAPVVVHGDVWQGNTMWVGEQVVGVLDWDCAGVGHCGVDLGSARCDAAIMFGTPAAGPVLEGWRAAAGRDPGEVAYWDLVAALGTPDDMGRWVPVIHDQGRTDLSAAVLQQRRDEFLRRAVRQLTAA